MLYQPKPRTGLLHVARRVLGTVAAAFAGLTTHRSDGAYLDGMRASELEDLGLRRDADGGYRFFR